MTKTNRKFFLFTGTAILLFLGLIYAWSLFRVSLTELFPHWTVSQISLTFTISLVFFCLGGFVSGKLLERTQPKKVIILAAILVLIGFLGVSFLSLRDGAYGLPMLYVFYGLFCGTGVGIGYNSIISTVNKWYAHRLGLSSGILMMGFGLGGILLGSGISFLIETVGLYSTFRILGVVIFFVLILGALSLKTPPMKEEDTTIEEGDYSWKEMAKTSTFWLFFLWTVAVDSAGLMIINSAAAITLAFGAPAVLGLIISIFNGLGRITMGGFFDRFQRKKTMLFDLILVFLGGLFLFQGALTRHVGFIVVGIMFIGLSYGGSPTISSAFVFTTFGKTHYPINFSVVNFALIPAAVIGPLVSSHFIEKSGGNYHSTFIFVIVLGIFSFIVWLLLNKMVRKVGKR